MLLAPTMKTVLDLISGCEVYACRYDIVYDNSEAECVVVLPPAHSKVTCTTPAKLNGCTIVDKFTYLGHVINEVITDDDIKKQTTKLTVTGNKLLRRFSLCSWEVRLAIQEPLLFYLVQLGWLQLTVLGSVIITFLTVSGATQVDKPTLRDHRACDELSQYTLLARRAV